ncbi:MAG: glycosyltransferase family 2 protein [Bacteroidota bacterium]
MFSIITVVYNDRDLLQRTLQSIRALKGAAFEYIVIDGGSTDGSVRLIEENADMIDQWVSAPDKGIYDAMNKGISKARGQYLNFMNAGDYFHHPEVLAEVSKVVQTGHPDIVYGKVVKQSGEDPPFYYEQGEPLSNKSFFLGNPMCHQAMFIQRKLFVDSQVGLYDLGFQAGAFYEWLAKYYAFRKELGRIRYIPIKCAIYLDGGFSFQAKRRIDRERLQSVRRYFPTRYIFLNYLRFLRESVKGQLLPIMERTRLLEGYRKVKYRKKKQAISVSS